MTIFVSIAAYRDLVLGFTMERALAAARAPDEIHFGVIDQTDTPLIKPPANYQVIAPEAARGPCWARARAMTFYRGEDWFLQLDSHMDFDPGWDARLISEARELGPKAVLSSYPRPFVFEDRRPLHVVTPHQAQVCAVMDGIGFDSAGPILKFHAYDVDVEQPVRAIHLGAGCLFAAGAFVRAFPYDPNLYFHGEEQSVFLRLYTHGWDVFHLPGMPIYHLYSDRPTGMEPRRQHWDAIDEAKRKIKWTEREAMTQRRLNDLVSGRLIGDYGLGKVRTLADYTAFSGIDYASRTIEPRAYLPRPALDHGDGKSGKSEKREARPD